MGYASQSGRARTSPSNPQAHAICDRCGFRYNHSSLSWQFDWRGASLQNIRLLVCNSCMDTPQNQLRAIVVPADPTPIQNPRVQDFVAASSMDRVTSGQNTVNAKIGIPVLGGDTRITQADKTRVVQQTGGADGSLNQQPGTDPAAQTPPLATEAGLPYGNTEVPETGPI